MSLYPLLRPLLFSLDPERAHDLALNALWLLQAARLKPAPLSAPRLSQQLWNQHFPNPVGLAAGYDKNAAVPLVWSALGFGFAELGTLTAQAQPGNPRPRLFRLTKDRACINRFGFNNDGATAAARHLEHLLTDRPSPIPLGINIGKSKAVPLDAATDDYLDSHAQLLPFADYLVVNVSSPNTPELRKLQQIERLGSLLEALLKQTAHFARQTHTNPKPLLVKIAPDLSDAAIHEIASLALDLGLAGLIATNTTLARPDLHGPLNEVGGLSGRPLAKRATEVLRTLFQAVEGKLPLIGVGGIFSAADAYERICAGASLVQVYTGLIYEGPSLPRRITQGLSRIISRKGIQDIREVIGSKT